MTLPIPVPALTQHVIALGKTRSGKSSKLRVCVEWLLDHDNPACIVDAKGDWWGLKSSADGKKSGYPLVIFGGEHADVPINAHSGAHIAELFATGNRSCLIDLGGWMIGERTRFFIDFASTLFKLTKGRRYVVIPEVHNFCPKGKIFDPEAGKMLHWANRLASEGLGKGIVLLADSQRPQKVHNDFLTSCETLVACKVIHKADRDAIKDWIDGCADPAIGKQMLDSLAGMQKPEAWCWSPEVAFGPKLITWPLFKTYDSFKPQLADTGKLKGWAEVDLDEVKSTLARVVEEARANDPKALKARIAELEKQLRSAQTDARTIPDTTYTRDLQDAEARGQEKGRDDASIAYYGAKKIVETAINNAAAALVQTLREATHKAFSDVVNTLGSTKIAVHLAPTAKAGTAKALAAVARQAAKIPTVTMNSLMARVGPEGSNALPKGERLVLTAIAQFGGEPVEQEQLFTLTGYKARSITEYVSRLRAKGYVGENWPITATQAGVDALGPLFEPLPTGDALLQHWRHRLSAGELKVLEVVASHYPDGISNADIGGRTEYAARSVTEYVSRLKARRLVKRVGGLVVASEALFS